RTQVPAQPFKLGIASGDPSSDSVVLWTRLAPRPAEVGGGMPQEAFDVGWQVADDEAMSRVVRSGTAVADPRWGHSVHAEVDGLRSDRWYWYRFTCGDEVSATGRTRTLPNAGASPDKLRFAVANCQKWEPGYYTAYEYLIREHPDIVLFLGDYIYEKDSDSDGVRPHGQKEVKTLDDYRIRYAIYKSDPALQAAHAVAPWFVTWDDHEVNNDYAGAISERPDVTPAEFLQRRAAAYQAYYENMPLRRTAMPSGPDLQLYRRFEYGRLARFHILDTRQYRTDQLAGPRMQPLAGVPVDPGATILGAEQKAWLFDGLRQSPAAWNAIAQQVLMARIDLREGVDALVDVDKWAGYEHERREVLRFLESARIRNPVVLTGDIHENWANELWNDFDSPEPRPVAVEFLGTSISSSGDGTDRPDYLEDLLRENPCVKYHNNERGYLVCEVTPKQWRTDFKTVEYVTRRGAPLNTRASFVIESGDPHLHLV
ncbi:MAG TPA: alkaline phosphatase D family protein, partial [Opitutaceae bacterium]